MGAERPRFTLTVRLGLLLSLSFLGSLVAIGVLVRAAERVDAHGRVRALAARQRMQAEELSAWVRMVAGGQDDDRAGLAERIRDMDDALTVLRHGGETRDGLIEPAAAGVAPALRALVESWTEARGTLDVLVEARHDDARFVRAASGAGPLLKSVCGREQALVDAVSGETETSMGEARTTAALLVGAAALVLVVGLFLARRHVVQPLLAASQAAERISTGDLSVRLPATGRDELGVLNRSLNHMAVHLGLQIESMRVAATAITQATDSVMVTDAQGTIQLVNPAFERLTGYKAAEVIGRTPRVLKSGRHDPSFYATMWKTLLAGQVFRGEMTNRRKDGTLFITETTTTPLRDERGAITHFVSANRDVTGQRSEEERRHLAEDRLEFVLSQIPVGFFALDAAPPYACRYVSDAVQTQLGLDPAAFSRDPSFWRTRVHPDDVPGVDREHESLMTSGRTVREYRFQDGNGEWHWLQDGTRLVRGADGHPKEVVGYWADITELVSARDASRKAEERYQALFNNASDAIYVVDKWGRFKAVNEAMLTWLGFRRDEILPLTIRDLGSSNLCADGAGKRSGLEERRWRRKGGSDMHVEVHERTMPDGSVVGVARDLSERDRAAAELRDLQARFMQSQKMEAVGRLAGGVAHDFNNLLSVIITFTGFAAQELPHGDPRREDLQEVLSAAHRAVALTRQLLSFSRKSDAKPQVIDLNGAIRDMENLLRRSIGEDVELTTNLDASVARVTIDPSHFEQVLLNLAVNARDAMPSGGHLDIRTRSEVLDAVAARASEVAPGSFTVMHVRDDGVGMSPETVARAFEPFFTTKEKGKGTGLGLSTVFGAVKQAGGFVAVDSAPGRGANFSVHLPATTSPPSAAASPGREIVQRRQLGNGEHVLVVEDDDSVRALTARMLERSGFRVVATSNAGEALLECERRGAAIDVVLTDVVMPRLSGRELVERLRARTPGIRAVFMSGYSDADLDAHGIEAETAPFVRKPFTEEQLGRAVNAALADRKT